MLKNDQMQRLGATNDIKNTFKEVEKDLDLKNKSIANKMH
jgi:hypothetical protein